MQEIVLIHFFLFNLHFGVMISICRCMETNLVSLFYTLSNYVSLLPGYGKLLLWPWLTGHLVKGTEKFLCVFSDYSKVEDRSFFLVSMQVNWQ